MRVLGAGIVAGFILFLWSAFSWMVLPWHNNVIHQWKNESEITKTLATASPQSGIYFSPMKMEKNEAGYKTPLVFLSIAHAGVPDSMLSPMILSLLVQIFAACFVAWMLFKTANLGYFTAVIFVTVFGLAAGLVGHVPYTNWFGFNPAFTGVEMLDLIIGWYLAGLVIAFFYRMARQPRN